MRVKFNGWAVWHNLPDNEDILLPWAALSHYVSCIMGISRLDLVGSV